MTVKAIRRIVQRHWDDLLRGEILNEAFLRALAGPVGIVLALMVAERLFAPALPYGRGLSVLYVLPIWFAAKTGGRLVGMATVFVVLAAFQITTPAEKPWLATFLQFVIFTTLMLGFEGMEKRLESVTHQADTDALTGLLNRRAFTMQGRKALGKCIAEKQDAAVLLFDCDKFKQINDIHGHKAGDQALTILAHALELCAQEGDVVSRLGGDEFVVLLTESDSIGTGFYLTNVRRMLAEASQSLPFEIAVSVGVARFGHDGRSLDALMTAADEAMFRNKNEARAAVTIKSIAESQAHKNLG